MEFSADKFLTDLYSDKAKASGEKAAEKAGEWKEKNAKDAEPPKGERKGNAEPTKAPAKPEAQPTVQPGGGKKAVKPADPNAQTAEGKTVKEYQEEARRKGGKPAAKEPKAGAATGGEAPEIHTRFAVGQEEHEINNQSGSAQLILSSAKPTRLDEHPNQKVRKAYATYLQEISQATSPTGKKEAANRNLKIIVAEIKAAGSADTPGASAPGIGTIGLHKNQQSRLNTSGIAVWRLEFEHVIPRAFAQYRV